MQSFLVHPYDMGVHVVSIWMWDRGNLKEQRGQGTMDSSGLAGETGKGRGTGVTIPPGSFLVSNRWQEAAWSGRYSAVKNTAA